MVTLFRMVTKNMNKTVKFLSLNMQFDKQWTDKVLEFELRILP